MAYTLHNRRSLKHGKYKFIAFSSVDKSFMTAFVQRYKERVFFFYLF